MPLVTRQANQGVFFKVPTEPPDWLNADIWTDTDTSNLAVNRNGTAVQVAVGTLAQGDLMHASTTDTLTALAKGTADQILTMNDAATLPNWETPGASGKWTTIEDHEASTTEASFTFTIDPAIDFDDDSMIILVCDYEATAAFALEMTINGLAAGYHDDGYRIVGGAETLINVDAAALGIIATATLSVANNTTAGLVEIMLGKAGIADAPVFLSRFVGGAGLGIEVMSHSVDDAEASINEVKIETSTSTWKAGSRFTLYKVAR